jgi:transposase
MARYKPYSYNEVKHLEFRYQDLLQPNTIEYVIHEVVDHDIDLSIFESRYRNDKTGAPAYAPAILLKIILYAYACGLISSRRIAKACEENLIFMALAAGAQPHFTTIAHFVSSMEKEIKSIFLDVLLKCEEQGLIGHENLALDGCKLSSNAAKEWSGTREEFEHKREKLQRMIEELQEAHRQTDRAEATPELYEREAKRLKTLQGRAQKLAKWLASHEEKIGARGCPIKSNVTDNDSAKMKSSHGVIQGYDGVAMVDQAHQVIVYAQAFGEAQEQSLLAPMIAGTREAFEAIGEAKDIFEQAKLTMDAGFHSEANMKLLFEEGIDAYVPDKQFRQRDPRFAEAGRHKPRRQKGPRGRKFGPQDFTYDPQKRTCSCPAGKRMYLKNQNFEVRGYRAVSFQAKVSDCRECELRGQCLQREEQKSARQVYFSSGPRSDAPETFTAKMKRKIDTWKGRMLYAMRLGIVEPVFGNLRNNIGLLRFTLRGTTKVNIQWLLYCIVHNIGKIYRYGSGFA